MDAKDGETITSVVVRAFLERSKCFNLVKLLREFPNDEIFSWYVPGSDSDLTSSGNKIMLMSLLRS